MTSTPAAWERRRAQAPLLIVAAAAWVALIGAQGAHGGAHGAPAPPVLHALLMFAAMMLPLAGPPVIHVRDRSLARRRPRAVAIFLAGYALPWMAATVALLAVAAWVGAAGSVLVVALAVVLIAGVQCSPFKQRCLNRCHAHPALAAFGPRADRDVLRFGVSHSLWCIGSCAALMLLPMLVHAGHLVAMAAVSLWLAGERLERPVPPRWRWRGPGMIVRIVVAQVRDRARRLARGAAGRGVPA